MNLLSLIKGGPTGVATLPWDGAAFAHWFAPDGPDATALRAQHAETRRQALRQAAAPMVSPLDSLPSTPDLARRFFNALPQGPSAQAASPPAPQFPPMQDFGSGPSGVPMPQPRPAVPTDAPQGPPMSSPATLTLPSANVPMPTPRPNIPGAARPPMPQPRPPSAPSPIPGYNPNVGNMADPSMMKGNLQARQILDPATGQMMNDFYTAKPWDVFSGPTQQSKGANIRDFLASLQRSRA
jgi:hypothetical protein